jgi:CRP/FNR family transcriptional regulator, cyclic AMP receptor protein
MTTGGGRLATHPFFQGWDGVLLEQLEPAVVERAYGPGEMLLKEGDPSNRFFLIREGKVALEIALPDRPTVTVQTLGSGEVMGWSWLLPPQGWQLDARAVKATRTLEIPATTLRATLEAHPAEGYRFLLRLLPVIAERLEHTRIQLLDLHGH